MKTIVHTVSPKINDCELTFLEREPIDFDLAVSQHQAYCDLLKKHGAEIIPLSANSDYPDSHFVEDTVIVFEEIAVITSMGVESRRGEEAAIETELVKHGKVVRVKPPATIEGGDVVHIGNCVFVGVTERTNEAGVTALKQILEPFNYEVSAIRLTDCLHLKSACSAISARSLLVNPDWVDITPFGEFNVITVDETEPWAANAIRVNKTVILPSGFPKTTQLLRELDFNVDSVDISEFLKAEGGVSCLSIRF